LRRKSVACKRNERMQNERVEKSGDRAHARSATENVNGCLTYSLCLKFMQNAYFGIPDTAGSVVRAGRVTVRASIYKLHKSSVARAPLRATGNLHSRNFASLFHSDANPTTTSAVCDVCVPKSITSMPSVLKECCILSAGEERREKTELALSSSLERKQLHYVVGSFPFPATYWLLIFRTSRLLANYVMVESKGMASLVWKSRYTCRSCIL